MKIKTYHSVCEAARQIRHEVFEKEQGFVDEFDEIDDLAAHFVAYDEQQNPIGTCRVFPGQEPGSYILGRLAVKKENRGKGIGADLIKAAEEYVKKEAGKSISLHAQCRAEGFYEKSGYKASGNIEEEQGCPHVWMVKEIS
jgi:predicted GNAT family N-acyltransferase